MPRRVTELGIFVGSKWGQYKRLTLGQRIKRIFDRDRALSLEAVKYLIVGDARRPSYEIFGKRLSDSHDIEGKPLLVGGNIGVIIIYRYIYHPYLYKSIIHAHSYVKSFLKSLYNVKILICDINIFILNEALYML